MMKNDLHSEMIALLQRAEEAAYARGKADAKRELLAFLGEKDSELGDMPAQAREALETTNDAVDGTSSRERQRAPKGLVRSFIIRVLRHTGDLTPQQIADMAETDHERMIKLASIRSELRSGREAGRYRDEHGHWNLVNNGEKKQAEGERSTEAPSAFTQDGKEGEPHATALNMFG